MLQFVVELKNAFFGDNVVKNVADRPGTFLSSFLPTIFVVSGFILFCYLVFGGFTIVSSAGNSENVQKGQKAITNAIIGFILIFVSYWIIQIIEIMTGVPILKSPQNI